MDSVASSSTPNRLARIVGRGAATLGFSEDRIHIRYLAGSLLTRLLGSVASERLFAMWHPRIEDADRIRSWAIRPLKIRLPIDALPWNLLE